MAKMNEVELKARLKSTAEDNLFLFYGEEKVQIRHYLEKLREKTAGKTADEFSSRTITQEDSLQTLYDSVLAAPSFLAEKIFVAVLDYDFTQLSDKETESLVALLANIPQTTVLVFAYPTSSPSFASGSNKKLLNAADKHGITVSFEPLTETALEKQLVYWAKLRDVKLNEYDAARIVSYCGCDLSLLKNELEKLCAYKAHGEITRDDIEKFVTKNLEARIFDIASYIINGAPDKAISQINILITQKESPQGIISVLGSVYVDIYRVRAALESGESLEALAKQLNYGKRTFVLQKAQRNGKRLSNSALRQSLNAIAETNAQLNSSNADGKILLEKLVARLTLIRTEAKN